MERPLRDYQRHGSVDAILTPGGFLFTQPGRYGYHDDAGDIGTVIVTANLPRR